eukprot:TRINITY_DN42869_c0_g1_i1.p1 TRINITY_DN42869_c0_g1~~TRINITY_DN42869_c0_g1_i1.p1  ORF type:complete len:820 (+),score=88.51 TRINITY_DN42869_c0_g1_i1:90-2462(+)
MDPAASPPSPCNRVAFYGIAGRPADYLSAVPAGGSGARAVSPTYRSSVPFASSAPSFSESNGVTVRPAVRKVSDEASPRASVLLSQGMTNDTAQANLKRHFNYPMRTHYSTPHHTTSVLPEELPPPEVTSQKRHLGPSTSPPSTSLLPEELPHKNMIESTKRKCAASFHRSPNPMELPAEVRPGKGKPDFEVLPRQGFSLELPSGGNMLGLTVGESPTRSLRRGASPRASVRDSVVASAAAAVAQGDITTARAMIATVSAAGMKCDGPIRVQQESQPETTPKSRVSPRMDQTSSGVGRALMEGPPSFQEDPNASFRPQRRRSSHSRERTFSADIGLHNGLTQVSTDECVRKALGTQQKRRPSSVNRGDTSTCLPRWETEPAERRPVRKLSEIMSAGGLIAPASFAPYGVMQDVPALSTTEYGRTFVPASAITPYGIEGDGLPEPQREAPPPACYKPLMGNAQDLRLRYGTPAENSATAHRALGSYQGPAALTSGGSLKLESTPTPSLSGLEGHGTSRVRTHSEGSVDGGRQRLRSVSVDGTRPGTSGSATPNGSLRRSLGGSRFLSARTQGPPAAGVVSGGGGMSLPANWSANVDAEVKVADTIIDEQRLKHIYASTIGVLRGEIDTLRNKHQGLEHRLRKFRNDPDRNLGAGETMAALTAGSSARKLESNMPASVAPAAPQHSPESAHEPITHVGKQGYSAGSEAQRPAVRAAMATRSPRASSPVSKGAHGTTSMRSARASSPAMTSKMSSSGATRGTTIGNKPTGIRYGSRPREHSTSRSFQTAPERC